MENKITVSGRDWVFNGNGKNCTGWTSSWFCPDGDIAILYIENKENNIGIGFTLNCFSGMPASNIYMSNVDFGVMWSKTEEKDLPIQLYSYEEQCVVIADYLCSLFCKWVAKA